MPDDGTCRIEFLFHGENQGAYLGVVVEWYPAEEFVEVHHELHRLERGGCKVATQRQ